VEKFLRRYINGDSCLMPTMYAQRLPGREGAGGGTVIIIVRIKEVGESENCVSCFRRGAVATEGEGHQKQEAQSVNPSIESSETNYFGEEGHQKQEAQSVNSPVRYNKVCYSPHLHPDTRRDPRSSVAETEYSEEDEMGKSAKVDAIQHSYLGPEIADTLGTQHQVIRFHTKQLLHREDARCCGVESQHVHSGRKQDRDLVQEDDSDSAERRRHREPSTTYPYVSNVNISQSPSDEEFKEVCGDRGRVHLRFVREVPQPFYLPCFDNIPAICSSGDLGTWNDVEDHQVRLISNGPDSSSVWSEKFDAECSQADGDCMESNEKNGKVENCVKLEGVVFPHKPTTKYIEDNEEITKNTKSKEFEDIQSGSNKENYKSFVLPSSDAEFVECQGEVGLEEPRSDMRSDERSGENSEETNEKYGDWRSGDIEGDVCAHREEVLYNPIQTAPSQTEFRSSQRRPTRSSVRPSRFRDEAFETQFQPRRKKKLRRVCLHPGRGESPGFSSVDGVCDLAQEPRKEQKYFRFGRGDQEAMKRGVSKQDGQTGNSLNWPTAMALFQGCRTTSCKNRYFNRRSTGWSRRIGLKFGRLIWPKTRPPVVLRTWRDGEKSIALNHQYRYRIEDLDTRSAEFRRGMCSKQLIWPHHRCKSGEKEDRRHERCNNSGLFVDQKRRAVHSTSFEPASSHRRRTMVSRPLIRTGCYVSGRRLKMNRPSLLRHETETGFRSRKLNHGKFRLNKLSRPSRFRPRKSVYGKRKLRQRQPGFSILSRRPLRFRIRSCKGEDTCKSVYGKLKLRQRQPGFSILSRHLLRFRIRNRAREEKCKLNHSYRICSEYSDIRIPRFIQHVRGLGRSGARAIIDSGIVTDHTGDLQATIDEINFGDLMSQVQSQCSSGNIRRLSPNVGLEKGELEETARSGERRMNQQLLLHKNCDSELYQHRKNSGRSAIMQQLLSTESIAGAQRLQYQMRKSSVEERRMCAMNNNVEQLSPSSARRARALLRV